MKLLLKEPIGLLKVGDTLETRTDEQGQSYIDAGRAELHPEQNDDTPMKNELYKDEQGNWRTRIVPIKKGEENLAIPAADSSTKMVATLNSGSSKTFSPPSAPAKEVTQKEATEGDGNKQADENTTQGESQKVDEVKGSITPAKEVVTKPKTIKTPKVKAK